MDDRPRKRTPPESPAAGPILIAGLAAHSEALGLVVGWFIDAWPQYYAGRSRSSLAADLAPPARDGELPIRLLAMSDGVPCGTAALKAISVDSRPLLSPWVDGLVVPSSHRRRGIGTKLIAAVFCLARDRGAARVYAGTTSKAHLFLNAGWNDSPGLASPAGRPSESLTMPARMAPMNRIRTAEIHRRAEAASSQPPMPRVAPGAATAEAYHAIVAYSRRTMALKNGFIMSVTEQVMTHCPTHTTIVLANQPRAGSAMVARAFPRQLRNMPEIVDHLLQMAHAGRAGGADHRRAGAPVRLLYPEPRRALERLAKLGQ